jgi:hypothetical protein
MNGWTTERQQRQSELIHDWKPWEASTGPKTIKGKHKASQNALKHGMRSAAMRKLQQVLGTMHRQTRNVVAELSEERPFSGK